MALLCTLGLVAAGADAQARPWAVWGAIWASAFSHWSLSCLTSVPGPGTYTLTVDGGNPPVLAGGPIIQPLAPTAPLLIDPGPDQELVTPSAVSCSWAPGSCTITVTLQHAHRAPFALRSGTDGLQEAINHSQSHGGGIVIVDPSWTGTTAEIEAAHGSTQVLVHDTRPGGMTWYAWNGSAYAPQLSLQPPVLTASAFNGTINVDALTGSGCGARELLALASTSSFSSHSLLLPPDCSDEPLTAFWAPNTSFALGQSIFDPNGGLETVTTAGTSGATPPVSWPAAAGGTTSDGSVVWTRQSANINSVTIADQRTGSPTAPLVNHTFYTPNFGISLLDSSPAHNVNLLTGENFSQQISPPDGNMAPIVKIQATETGAGDPVPLFASLYNDAAGGGVNSVAGAFSNYGSATDQHQGIWGINESVGVRNPNFHQQLFGNEVNLANETGVDPGSPASGNSFLPYWGFAATSYGNAPATAAYWAGSSFSSNRWHIGLLIEDAQDAAVQCGYWLSAFNGLCVNAMSQGAATYSGGEYFNEASIPERDNAAVMTSTTQAAESYIQRQLVPGNTANPRTCWSYAYNASPVTSALQKSCSDGLIWNTGWIESASNFGGKAPPGADIGQGGSAIGWNYGSAGETDLIDNTAGQDGVYFDWFAQAAPAGALSLQAFLDPSGFHALQGLTSGTKLAIGGALSDAVQATALFERAQNNVTSLKLDQQAVAAWRIGMAAGSATLCLDVNDGTMADCALALAPSGNLQVEGSISSAGGALAVAGSCPASQFMRATVPSAAPTCVQPQAEDLSNGTVGSGAVVLASALPLTGSVAGSTAPLAGNSCGDVVVTTVADAQPGMVAVASATAAFPAAANALTVAAAVTAANTISVGYCNHGTAPITPAAATIQLRIIP